MSNSGKLDNQICEIFHQLFEVSPEQLHDDIRRGELARWDSLGHLELLDSLQKEFKIEIPLEIALGMETVRDVKQAVVDLQPQSRFT